MGETALKDVSSYETHAGMGVAGEIGGARICGGNKKLMAAQGVDLTSHLNTSSELANAGKTVLYFSKGKDLIGVIALADTVKPESAAAVAELSRMSLDVVMLTGDDRRAAESIAGRVGIKKVVAEILPDGKEREIRALQESGKKVAMVGDGINDAPALARADVGVAIGAGTDIAIESAGIVLMKSDLRDVAASVRLSKAVMRNIRQNLFWAFIYNAVGIPLAAGAFYYAFGWLLSPMAAAAAMSFSSVSVVSNALRLNFFKMRKHERNIEAMTKTLKIEGMSCAHCANAVAKALNGVAGAGNAVVDLAGKKATVEVTSAVEDEMLRAAVEDAGYHVVR
jgi:P-type E1-E2 ATPase